METVRPGFWTVEGPLLFAADPLRTGPAGNRRRLALVGVPAGGEWNVSQFGGVVAFDNGGTAIGDISD